MWWGGAPLAMGAVDVLAARGHAAFGPPGQPRGSSESKAFAKELMMRAGVPTARYEVYEDPEGSSGGRQLVGWTCCGEA